MKIGRYEVTIEFKIEDFWIGIYWKRKDEALDIWICLITCFPIHIKRRF